VLGGVDVTAPDGTAWRVGRRWTSRSVRWPPRRRRERERDFGDGDGWLDFDFPDLCDVGDDFLGGIALALAYLFLASVIVVVLWPVLAIGFEVTLLVLFLGSGVFGRVFLRRPWTVQAVRDGATGPARTWKVVGWRRSGRHVMDVAGAIASGRALPPGA
jgi:hypothetical protein